MNFAIQKTSRNEMVPPSFLRNIAIILAVILTTTKPAIAFYNGQSGSFVVGQPDFTTTVGAIDAGHVNRTYSCAAGAGKFFVADRDNNRVLIYNSLPTSYGFSANNVVGQVNVTSGGVNQGGVAGSNTLYGPSSIAIYGTRLFIADSSNNRVLIYNTIPAGNNVSADVVIGQSSFSGIFANQGAASPTSQTLSYPSSVFCDGTRVYIVDNGNNRVLVYNSIPASNGVAADVVVGQASMSTRLSNQGGMPGANTLDNPGEAKTASGKLIISDTNNKRVLIFNTIPTANNSDADVVLGQYDFLGNGTWPTSASSMAYPYGLEVSGSRLFIGDGFAYRVVIFDTIPTSNNAAADIVLGHDTFTSVAIPPPDKFIYDPAGMTFQSGNLYIPDAQGNRILVFGDDAAPTPTLTQTPCPACTPTNTPTISPTFTVSQSYSASPSPSSTRTPSPSPTATPLAGVFDNFEGPYATNFWGGGPTSSTYGLSTDTSISGSYSWKIQNGAGVGYGHWVGMDASSLSSGAGPMNFAGTTTVSFWVKVDQNISVRFHWNEGITNGADGEDWYYQLALTGSSSWQQITIPLVSFGGGGGNSIMDTQSVQFVWFDWSVTPFVPYPAHTLYVDDIVFSGSLPLSQTLTPTRTVTYGGTTTMTPTRTISPTFTVTPTQGALVSAVCDDFEDGDLITINGGGIITLVDGSSACSGGASSGGCSYGSTQYCYHMSGSVGQDVGNNPYAYADFPLISGGGSCDLRPWATRHCVSFSIRNNTPGAVYHICLESGAVLDGDDYCFDYTPVGTGWQTCTIYFPDVPAAAGINRFSQGGFGTAVSWGSCVQSIRSYRIGCKSSTGGPVGFDCDIDDISFGVPLTGSNPLAVATAFSVSLADVMEARGLQIDEFMTWVILRLSKHCGCHPHDILLMRNTMSWGEIAIAVGSDWASIWAEVQGLATAAGLTPAQPSLVELERTLSNHTLLTPAPTPAPYVPSAALPVAPDAVAGCPW